PSAVPIAEKIAPAVASQSVGDPHEASIAYVMRASRVSKSSAALRSRHPENVTRGKSRSTATRRPEPSSPPDSAREIDADSSGGGFGILSDGERAALTCSRKVCV